MNFWGVAIAVSYLVVVTHGKIAVTESYKHFATLRTGNTRLYWNFNDSHITFEVHGETTGWIGIGISPNGMMAGSDIVVGWVTDNEVRVTDRHAVGNALPPLDSQQDIHVIEGAECDGWTMFKFTRQLAACDTEHDREITQSTERLIWAWGTADPDGVDLDLTNYHGTRRGVESMYFLESSMTPTGLPEGPTYHSFDVMMENFEIPAVDTYYNCKLFKMPRLAKKHHIVKIAAVITKGNEVNVHHILIYRCGDKLENKKELLKDTKCFSPNMNNHHKTCTTVIAGWAVGGGPATYPEDAGFSIGEEGDPLYILIEVHYDNPGSRSGIIDSSGIRFTYTDALRKYDLAIIDMGVNVDGTEHIIPPRATSFLTAGHCPSQCFENAMKDAGVQEIYIAAVMLHTHLAGRKVKLTHLRGGVELEPLAYDDSYDFNYQETRYIHPPRLLKSTDRTELQCFYGTDDRTNITQGQFGTKDEMCTAFVTYYPKIDLSVCISGTPKEVIWNFFRINASDVELVGTDPLELNSWRLPDSDETVAKTMYDHINEWDWTPETIKTFETYFNNAPHYGVCIPQNPSEMDIIELNMTMVTTAYQTLPRVCKDMTLPLSQRTSKNECSGGTSVMNIQISTVAMLLPISVFFLR